MKSSAIESATDDPASSDACMLPSTQTAGRTSSGFGPIVKSQMSRPSSVFASDSRRTTSGCASAQALTWAVSSS